MGQVAVTVSLNRENLSSRNNIVEIASSADPDKATENELAYLDLDCKMSWLISILTEK